MLTGAASTRLSVPRAKSELFSYEKGAFTGAQASKPGKFEQADTGTVFLDEIGDVPAAIQVKLLRILQEREFERLGSNVTRHIDVRVIAATNQDLRAALEQGTFARTSHRLNVVPLNIPSLREPKQDIPFLANHFVRKLAPETGCRVESITEAGMEKLMAYHWPGDVRELENVIERSLVMCGGTEQDAADIRLESAPRPDAQNDAAFVPDGMSLDEYEQEIIREALRRAAGNKSQAARLLGLTECAQVPADADRDRGVKAAGLMNISSSCVADATLDLRPFTRVATAAERPAASPFTSRTGRITAFFTLSPACSTCSTVLLTVSSICSRRHRARSEASVRKSPSFNLLPSRACNSRDFGGNLGNPGASFVNGLLEGDNQFLGFLREFADPVHHGLALFEQRPQFLDRRPGFFDSRPDLFEERADLHDDRIGPVGKRFELTLHLTRAAIKSDHHDGLHHKRQGG